MRLLLMMLAFCRRAVAKDCDLPLELLNSMNIMQIPDGCTTLNGHVLLNGSSVPTQDQLTQKFSSVTTINNGLVLIAFTPITSLSFFQNLQTIKYLGNTEFATFMVMQNMAMTTLNIPNLTSVTLGTNYSAVILQNSALCLTRTELNNLVKMDSAMFLMNPICGVDSTYCVETASGGVYTSTDDIPAGCQYMNAALQLNQINDVSKIQNLKEIYGAILILNTTISNLTLNVELIYNQFQTDAPAITVAYNQLQSFQTPYLSKVKSSYTPSENIYVVLNPNLQMTETTCSIWSNVSSYMTMYNKVDCSTPQGTGPSGSETGNPFYIIFFCLIFNIHFMLINN